MIAQTKELKGIVVNELCPCLNKGSLEFNLTLPLMGFQSVPSV